MTDPDWQARADAVNEKLAEGEFPWLRVTAEELRDVEQIASASRMGVHRDIDWKNECAVLQKAFNRLYANNQRMRSEIEGLEFLRGRCPGEPYGPAVSRGCICRQCGGGPR